MNEIILCNQSGPFKDDYIGNSPKEFDKFLLVPSYSFKYTYINKFDENTLVFRVTGATRLYRNR